uniref:Eosinophil peroxidase n=1 Tax=Seriola dumerili TaxID=41447 RepID=A0A3B4V9D5_SERDU
MFFFFPESRLSRSVIEDAVTAAKATVDNAYEYSRQESIDRVRRNAASPSDVLRLLKQPAGPTRTAVRAADYMDVAVKLLKRSLNRRPKRSINATGDERNNENICLTSLHTLLMREHNRLARALAKTQSSLGGERLYQEARKIMGGYFQVREGDYLLHIVGPDFIAKQLSTYLVMMKTWTPASPNVFATAAYRFAHLMFSLSSFFAPWRIVFEGGVDPILRGLVGRQAKLNTDRLFKFSAELALDLGALNMQRGRDHGLPGYNKWRKFCGLSQPRNLAQLAKVMNNTDLAKNLLNLYGTPDNIDVWLGGVAEPFVRGGRVGPLFACLIATQFQRIRQGDRLWWENEGVFTEAQRESLRETSLARIMCDNTGITEVPDRPFQYRPRGSGYTQCEDIPTF